MKGRNQNGTIITTQCGLQVRVRRLQPDDTQHLLDIFDQMSSDSRYHRFSQSVDNVSEELKWKEASRITGADLHHGNGLIAFADLPGMPDTAVGAARYVCVGDGVAEAAMSVIDAVQRQGLGTKLMLLLAEYAQADGVRELRADIRSDNEAIRKILRRLPYKVTWVQGGECSQVLVDLRNRPTEMRN